MTPGLVDIHTHVYAGTGERRSYAGDNSVYPDGFTFRVGVTTIADAGSSGWRNFEDFHDRVIGRAKTRVLAFLNIVGHGMRGGAFEQDTADMEAQPAAEMARRHRDTIVGIKTAHFEGPAWTPVERAVEAGTLAGVPVMVDFGKDRPERPIEDLILRKLRPGDIYTHLYSGLRRELVEGRANAALAQARDRGVIFDVGHGAGSFRWRVAVPIVKGGFLPDSISTDLHISSMNAGMKDMLNVMSKFLALGLSLPDVIARSTWNPARQIRQQTLGHLSVGAPADVAVLRLERGRFGFLDMDGVRMAGSERLVCEADRARRRRRLRPQRTFRHRLAGTGPGGPPLALIRTDHDLPMPHDHHAVQGVDLLFRSSMNPAMAADEIPCASGVLRGKTGGAGRAA